MILSAIAEKLKRRSKNDFRGRHFEASLIYWLCIPQPTDCGMGFWTQSDPRKSTAFSGAVSDGFSVWPQSSQARHRYRAGTGDASDRNSRQRNRK